jgi:signal transduction histidine kinase
MISLDALRQCLSQGVPPGRSDDDSVRRQWWAALATLQDDLLLGQQPLEGLWLAAPLPALYEPEVLSRLQGWIWAPAELEELLPSRSPLLPATASGRGAAAPALAAVERLALQPADGLEPLLVVITPMVQVGLCLDGPPQGRRLVVRFDADVLSRLLALVHQRLEVQQPAAADRLRAQLTRLESLHSDSNTALRFWPRLAERLSAMAPSLTLQPLVHGQRPEMPQAVSSELALLEALTHEVRTPLATIRTLIRSLLRRSDLATVVRERLEQIDSECSEQIDRFGLIFLATELQRQPTDTGTGALGGLAQTDLAALLERHQELWQRQLQRRGLCLQLQIAPELPPVLSDPVRLETVLGGLIDRFGRSLPAGSQVSLTLQPAGPRIKLQLSSEAAAPAAPASGAGGTAKPLHKPLVGPVLSWNPATGSLQLSRQATQRLFQHLGSRFTERSDNGLTVFFPAATGSVSGDPQGRPDGFC